MARYTRGVTHPEGTTFPSPAFPLGSQGLVAARTSGDGMGQDGPAGRALQGRAQARGFVAGRGFWFSVRGITAELPLHRTLQQAQISS